MNAAPLPTPIWQQCWAEKGMHRKGIYFALTRAVIPSIQNMVWTPGGPLDMLNHHLHPLCYVKPSVGRGLGEQFLSLLLRSHALHFFFFLPSPPPFPTSPFPSSALPSFLSQFGKFLKIKESLHVHTRLLSHVWLFVTPWTVCHPPGSSVHGILQARILEWVTISFSRGFSQPRDRTRVSCIGRQILHHWATWESQRET